MKQKFTPLIIGLVILQCITVLQNAKAVTTNPILFNIPNLMNPFGDSPNGSFKDYYIEVSYGLLTVNTTVIIWVALPHTHDYHCPRVLRGTFAYDAIVSAQTWCTVNPSGTGNGTIAAK